MFLNQKPAVKTERLTVQILILLKGGHFIYLFFVIIIIIVIFFLAGRGGEEGFFPNPAFNVVHNPSSFLFV